MSATSELRRFWQWRDNEKPEPYDAVAKAQEVLCPEALEPITRAALEIEKRQHPNCDFGLEAVVAYALREHPEALRDLSLALCAALERMREQVPEALKLPEGHAALGWKETTVTTGWFRPDASGFGRPLSATLYDVAKQMRAHNAELFRREYLGEWASERSHCLKPGEAPDGLYCRECVSTPCRKDTRRRREGFAICGYSEKTETLDVYANRIESFAQADRCRGYRPKVIRVEMDTTLVPTEAQQYLMGQILSPMIQDGARLEIVQPD